MLNSESLVELYIKDISFDEAPRLRDSARRLARSEELILSVLVAHSSVDMATECGWMSSGKSPFYGSIMVGFSSN